MVLSNTSGQLQGRKLRMETSGEELSDILVQIIMMTKVGAECNLEGRILDQVREGGQSLRRRETAQEIGQGPGRDLQGERMGPEETTAETTSRGQTPGKVKITTEGPRGGQEWRREAVSAGGNTMDKRGSAETGDRERTTGERGADQGGTEDSQR